jgi:hypothetical protein
LLICLISSNDRRCNLIANGCSDKVRHGALFAESRGPMEKDFPSRFLLEKMVGSGRGLFERFVQNCEWTLDRNCFCPSSAHKMCQ